MSSLHELDYPPAANQTHGVEGEDISTPHALREWMRQRIDQYQKEIDDLRGTDPQGRIYIARTIGYYPDRGLTQTGSAPGFHGGVWTIATCKKPMREAGTFKDHFDDSDEQNQWRPEYPVFMVTLSSRDSQIHPYKPDFADEHRAYLVSVALVTDGFEGMRSLGEFLDQHFDGKAVRDRKTGASNASAMARNRGDVHVEDRNEVVYPPAEHQHGSEDHSDSQCGCDLHHTGRDPFDHEDNQLNRVNCLSRPGFWVAWKEPKLAFTKENFTQGQLRLWGDYSNLIDRLAPVGE